MPFQMISDMKPKANSLIVCAGTISQKTVASMGSGFNFFKGLFKYALWHDNNRSWVDEFQDTVLDPFFKEGKKMPAYVRVAVKPIDQENQYIGGIATVPQRNFRGLNAEIFTKSANDDAIQKAQYKSAIEQAILDAKLLKRPLFIQPLGIGVYGWSPEEAAILFAEAIVEIDPNDEIDITIPIYDQKPGSNDLRFQSSLTTELGKRRINSNQQSTATTDKSVVKLNPLPPDERKKPEPKPDKLDQKNDESINKPNAILSKIIKQLIDNIEHQANGRYTSGTQSKKVEMLRNKLRSIEKENDLGNDSAEFQAHLIDIQKICEIKRNPWHFWHAPESVKEYTDLLNAHGIVLDGSKGNNPK